MNPISVQYVLSLSEHYEAIRPAIADLVQRRADSVRAIASQFHGPSTLSRIYSRPRTYTDTVLIQIYIAWIVQHLSRTCYAQVLFSHEHHAWRDLIRDSQLTEAARPYDLYLLRALFWISANYASDPDMVAGLLLDERLKLTITFNSKVAYQHNRIRG